MKQVNIFYTAFKKKKKEVVTHYCSPCIFFFIVQTKFYIRYSNADKDL